MKYVICCLLILSGCGSAQTQGGAASSACASSFLATQSDGWFSGNSTLTFPSPDVQGVGMSSECSFILDSSKPISASQVGLCRESGVYADNGGAGTITISKVDGEVQTTTGGVTTAVADNSVCPDLVGSRLNFSYNVSGSHLNFTAVNQ